MINKTKKSRSKANYNDQSWHLQGKVVKGPGMPKKEKLQFHAWIETWNQLQKYLIDQIITRRVMWIILKTKNNNYCVIFVVNSMLFFFSTVIKKCFWFTNLNRSKKLLIGRKRISLFASKLAKLRKFWHSMRIFEKILNFFQRYSKLQ